MSDSSDLDNLGPRIVEEFESWFTNVFIPHQEVLLEKWKIAENHKMNPYLLAYRSAALSGDKSALGIAEGLITLSWLGQGLSTSFGMQFQTQLTRILQDVYGSTTSGIDVEYPDYFDKRKKFAQIKLGPDTINSDDVETIDNHFKSIKRLAKTNNVSLQVDDLVVGVIYGTHLQLNANYNALKNLNYEVYVGNEFFEHLTGVPDLGTQLIDAAVRSSKNVKVDELLKEAIGILARDPNITGLI